MANTSSAQVTVTTSATALEPAGTLTWGNGRGMIIRNRGTAAVYLGGSGVTTSTGF